MKNFFIKLFMLISFYAGVTTSVQAATETYQLDPSHTFVLWHISHFDFSHPSGKWPANGTLTLDQESPEKSKISVTIRIADIQSGIKKLDEHIKSELFFDAKKFPQATFVSDKVDLLSKDTAKVYGTLTLHGVSKPIVLSVKLNKMALNPITNKKTVGFSATTELKRSDFGISAYLPGLGDDIAIEIESEAAIK